MFGLSFIGIMNLRIQKGHAKRQLIIKTSISPECVLAGVNLMPVFPPGPGDCVSISLSADTPSLGVTLPLLQGRLDPLLDDVRGNGGPRGRGIGAHRPHVVLRIPERLVRLVDRFQRLEIIDCLVTVIVVIFMIFMILRIIRD